MTMMGPSVLGRWALLFTWLVLCLIYTWEGVAQIVEIGAGKHFGGGSTTRSTRQSSQLLASRQAKGRGGVVVVEVIVMRSTQTVIGVRQGLLLVLPGLLSVPAGACFFKV
jgi:hypothetical protein